MDELATLEKKFTNLNLLNSKQEHFFEVDTQGIRVLNILCGDDYKLVLINKCTGTIIFKIYVL